MSEEENQPSVADFTEAQCSAFMDELELRWVGVDGPTRTRVLLEHIANNVSSTDCAAESRGLERLLRQIAELFLRLGTLGMLDNTMVRARIDKLLKVTGHCSMVLKNVHQLQYALQDSSEPGDLNGTFFAFNSMSSLAEDMDTKNIHRLFIHLTTQAQIHGYRRYQGGVYEPRRTSEGYNTYSWSRVCDIKEFVYLSCRKELFYQQWKWLTEKPNHAPAAINYLTDCQELQFPRLVKHRSAFSFQNGVYLAHEDRFAPYGSQVRIPRDICCAKYFDLDFPTEFLDEEWRHIPTPAFDTILDTQRLPSDVRDWLLVFYGRVLYDVGALDNWQVMLFIKGVAGAGKSSTIEQIAGNFYEKDDVGQLTNNIEKQFGLSAFFDKLMFCAAEIKSDFKIDQAGASLNLLPSSPHCSLQLPPDVHVLPQLSCSIMRGLTGRDHAQFQAPACRLWKISSTWQDTSTGTVVSAFSSQARVGGTWVRSRSG